MPNLWRPGDNEAEYETKHKAKTLLDLLKTSKDNGKPWLSLFTIEIELSMDEFTAIGIIFYLWLQDKVWVSRGETGDLMLMYPYEPPEPSGEE